jgi:hypothetical protein
LRRAGIGASIVINKQRGNAMIAMLNVTPPVMRTMDRGGDPKNRFVSDRLAGGLVPANLITGATA